MRPTPMEALERISENWGWGFNQLQKRGGQSGWNVCFTGIYSPYRCDTKHFALSQITVTVTLHCFFSNRFGPNRVT